VTTVELTDDELIELNKYRRIKLLIKEAYGDHIPDPLKMTVEEMEEYMNKYSHPRE
jgi:hypothetical protein